MSVPPSAGPETGWTRLAAVWEAATARVEPGDPVRVGWEETERERGAVRGAANRAAPPLNLAPFHSLFLSQIPPAPPELADWGSNTMMVASFGAIYTGLREWRTQAAGGWPGGEKHTPVGLSTSAHLSHHVCPLSLSLPPTGPPITIPPGLGPQDAAKAVSAEQMRRLAKAGAAATGGAARTGGLAGFFWALQLGAGIARGVRSPIADTAGAASATGALFGAMRELREREAGERRTRGGESKTK